MSDVVLVLSDDLTILWGNWAVQATLGHEIGDIIGRSIADFVHHDDLERAAEVMSLVAEGRFETAPITPALYRVRQSDGEWVSLEINAARASADEGELLVVGRFAGDLVVGDRLLEAVTAGETFGRQVELVLQMGLWRYPNEGYAIVYGDLDTPRRMRHADLPAELYGVVELPGPSPWAVAMETGQAVTVTSAVDMAGSDVIGEELAQESSRAGYVGCLCVPVPDPSGLGPACIIIWTTAAGPSIAGHRYLVDNMSRALALVLQQRAQRLALERAAHIDELTDSLSRTRFFELLAEADQGPGAVGGHAVLYVDLDHFKSINDGLGHRAGDQVLRVAAQRIHGVVPDGSLVGRIGGDEFGVLCPRGIGRDGAVKLADSIIEVVGRPVDLGDGVCATIGASVGVAVGEAGEMANDVLDRADGELIVAKGKGRSRSSAGTTVTTATGSSSWE